MINRVIEAALHAFGFQGPPVTPSERLVLVESNFTSKERKALINDGAVPYLLVAETMSGQREAGRRFWSIWHEGQPIETLASRIMEVAIYPDPKRFFVPDTFNKLMAEQERLVKLDAKKLRTRLGLADIDEVLPEVPEAVEVLFRHLAATGVYLLGKDYRDPDPETRYYRYMRTKTRTDVVGSCVADVGDFDGDFGPYVHRFPVDKGNLGLGAARWVVKKGTR